MSYTFCVVVNVGGVVTGRRVVSIGAALLGTGVVTVLRVVVVGGRVSIVGLRVGGILYTGFLVVDGAGRLATVGFGRGEVFRNGFFVVVVATGDVVLSFASDVDGRCVEDLVVDGRLVVFLVVFLVDVVVVVDLPSVVVGNVETVVVSWIDWNVCNLILSVDDGVG